MADLPHLAFPFRLAGAHVAVVEQDDLEHIDACCQTILRCPTSWRVDRPEFGWDFPEFRSYPIDTAPLAQALRRLEPRATPRIDQYIDSAANAAAGISITEEVSS
jgi:hypothetical protein